MTQSDYTMRVLNAAEDHFITESADVPDEKRLIAKKVYLAVNDAPENYKEITAEEAERIRKIQEAVMPKLPEEP